jgi:hypothetical protein
MKKIYFMTLTLLSAMTVNAQNVGELFTPKAM